MSTLAGATVVSVSLDAEHRFSKQQKPSIRLVAGHGVEGDAHFGRAVQHRSRVAIDPAQPNHRQVHLIHEELFEDLRRAGFWVRPGDLGENVTTRGIDLLALPVGTLISLGADAIVEVTGLRNPCAQIDNFKEGLLKQVCFRSPTGDIVRTAGIMGVVRSSGVVMSGNVIHVELPDPPFRPLDRV